ncbi:MAG: carbon starvation protein A [Deltaproteobacteria bacterium]|nr:carbon starvation protein A [Deltaproteobacteria bacterium]
MNALWLVVAAACTYLCAYRFYSAFLAAKVFALDDRRRTPAVRLADGRDFHATNKWVLFGHHFAAIAGAGPLIGPVLAAQFGYLPGALWILVGAVFAGAVHDFVVLVASVRRNGCSLAEIARAEIGPVAGLAASFAILFIIVVALAGLGLAVVNALAHSPWGTFTIACTIPIALLMGLYLYKIRYGKVVETTAIGVTLLVAAVLLGHEIVGSRLEPYFVLSRGSLVWAMAIYGFTASVLPVWLLLCPRDYLSTYMKIGTILLLAVGIIVLAPELRMPAVTRFAAGQGPVIPGTLFPFMFITIACGAVSGFHSLVGSGTTPKMVSRESECRAIGFGAMLVEGFVSIMALVAASVLVPGDYFAINSTLGADALTGLGFAPERIEELSRLVGTNVAGRPGGAVSLAVGMASVFAALPGMKHLMAYWYNFALMFEALFILTTVDTGTRVARFLVQEMAGKIYRPLGRHGWLPGTLATSFFVVAAWGLLISSGSISTIWPMFGVANQLLAALALAVGTTVLIKMRKVRYAPVTFVPLCFMAVMTLTASYQLVGRFWRLAAAEPDKALTHHFDAVLVLLMAGLAVIILADSAIKWWLLLTGRRPLTTSEVPFEEASKPGGEGPAVLAAGARACAGQE